MSDKKYILTDLVINLGTHTAHRIQAIRDFADVHEGDLGGWVESEGNLSHNGTCWVYDDAIVCGDARVVSNARIEKNASLMDGLIRDHAIVSGRVEITNHAIIFGNAIVDHNIVIASECRIRNEARISSDILGPTYIREPVRFSYTPERYITIGPIGSRRDTTTFYRRQSDQEIWVETGCFVGNLEQFESALQNRHLSDKRGFYKDYTSAIELAQQYLNKTR